MKESKVSLATLSCPPAGGAPSTPAQVACLPDTTALPVALRPLCAALFEVFQALPKPLAIACSGGLDSRFLAFMAHLMGFLPHLVHVSGPHVPLDETKAALSFAEACKLQCTVIASDPLAIPEVACNSRERCYHCKKFIFSHIGQEFPGYTLCDGSHRADSKGYRPGMRALKELGIISPLAEAGFAKHEIRLMAAHCAMENPGQKARPCLFTRFPYGFFPTAQQMHLLAQAEEHIFALLAYRYRADLPDFRLRYIAKDILELHIEQSQTLPLDPDMREALRNAAWQANPAMARPEIVFVDSLSGFFDRLEGLGGAAQPK